MRRAGLGRAAGLISNQYRHDSEFRHDHAQQLPEALSFFGLRLRSFQSFDRFDRHRLDLKRVQAHRTRFKQAVSRLHERDAADARHALRILHRHTKN